MSNSSLINVKVPASSKNYTKGRQGNKIKKITIHHMAGVMSAEQCGKLFQNAARQTSSHYGIGNDGKIGLYVDEKNIAWTDGNWSSNCVSVTIETSNNKTGGKWTVGSKALNSLIKLVADIGYRNNLGTLVKGKNVTWHSMYAATTCPGDYLRSKMDYIVKEANKINEKKRKSTYPTGDYKCNYAMNLRTGAGTNFRLKKVKEMTAAGQKHATSKNPEAKAQYKKGTIFTATKITKKTDGSIWGKSPSGWLCLKGKVVKYCTKL